MTVALSGYQIGQVIYTGTRTLVYRGQRESDNQPVVIKFLRNEYPTFNELLQFRNQYTIAKNLNIPGIIRPHRLESYGNSYALVMEDCGDISLRQYSQTHCLELTDGLTLALQLAQILHDLHQNRVIHKDIKPDNILIHPDTKQVKLIDFSIASLLPKETQEIKNPNGLEGTLAYLAPEQTGRMNRGIDYRADFYALGVTLFELLAGELPFKSDDPMELVHCHIAKQSPTLAQFNSPEAIAQIVAKLMAKNAEDRYQSALGLKHDLQQCLTQWKAQGEITEFELGQRDLSDRFNIPDKLYGREREVQTLLEAFERVAKGTSELMLVAGFSGIGKTAVINEVHKPIVRQHGYFIKGKFDQFNRNIPLSALVQAFRDLMGQLFSESDGQLAQWQAKILAAVGENGQVLIDVIPELEQIIGKQPPAPELSGSAAQNRFNLLFQKFIEVFTTKDHPLVLFLDDLQWADSASLQLIELLMSDNGYLLILGAYRDNEVSASHPFIMTIKELKKTGAIVNTITLASLAFEDTNQLVADTLNCSKQLAKPLSELVDRKTKGNPFFTTQFLKALYEDGLITFNHVGEASQNENRCYWECDIAQVNALALTDDVVEFMALQLQKLPDETQQVLKLAACVGNQFDLKTLAIVSEQSQTDAATALWKALQEGLILPKSQIYKFFQSEDLEPSEAEKTVNPKYRFLHDRIQQAAYSLIPENKKQATHLQIGQLLQQNLSDIEQEEKLFDLVGHLNLGQALIAQSSQREALARLNLAAGRNARKATAYAAATAYLQAGIDLLTANCWQSQYDLTLNLYVSAAEAAYLNADLDLMNQIAAVVLKEARAVLDKVKIYEIQIAAQTAQGKMLEAIATGRTALAQLGVELPSEPNEAEISRAFQNLASQLQDKSIEELLDLPEMIDPQTLATMQLLSKIFAPIFMGMPSLLPSLSATIVQLSLQFGNAATSTVGYIGYGVLLCNTLGDPQTGYRFGKLAMNLREQFNAQKLQPIIAVLFGGCIQYRQEALRTTIATQIQGYRAGIETGEFLYASYNLVNSAIASFFVGTELDTLEPEIAGYRAVMTQIKQDSARTYLDMQQQMMQNLTEVVSQPDCLVGTVYDETVMLPQHKRDNELTAFVFVYIYKLVLAYSFGNYRAALDYVSQLRLYQTALQGTPFVAIFHFYAALANLAVFSVGQESVEILNLVETHQTTLHQWAQTAPMNYRHKWDLIEAEWQRVLGNRAEAINLYDRAISGAKENQYLQEEALANELAAKFYLNWGKEKVAASYMQEAYYCYAKWGALAKTDDLEQRYPHLLRPILQQAAQTLNPLETLASLATPNLSIHASTKNSRSSSTNINTALDFAAVLKSSQSLSSTIQLDGLLHQLTQIILQNSGGDRCALILPNSNGEWQLQAIATPEKTELCSEPLENNPHLPIKLIQYVKNTQELVVIDNLKTNLPVIGEYLSQHQPKSVLCLSILDRGNLVGILYLENRGTSGVFTGDRILILNFLCTQAAISLENARLYQNLQYSENNEREKAEQLAQTLELLQIENRKLAFRSDVDAVFTRDDNLSQMLQSCTEAIVQHLNAAFARIWTLNPNENVLELQASAGQYTHLDGLHSRVPVGELKIGRIAQERCPHLTNDVLNDPRVGNKTWAKQEGMIAFAGYPLIVEDRLVGVMALFARQSLTDETLTMLMLVADEIALGIRRKQLEQELQKSESQLRQKARQLEEALQQLEQSQLQLVQSEKMSALGNLVAGVAHEINNPIGCILGNVGAAQDYINDLLGIIDLYGEKFPQPGADIEDELEAIELDYVRQDLPKLIKAMKDGGDRITSISKSLRTFSRADSDTQQKFNLHDGIDSTILILRHRLKANEHRPAIQVVTNYGQIPEIACFPGQLNQVFMNILANAIDALDESNSGRNFAEIQAHPNRITIRTTVENDRVKVAIADNGKGIPEDIKSRIFDHLFTTKGVGKGTGLGLAIARQIVEDKHGGTLLVTSNLGQGTEFTITLNLN